MKDLGERDGARVFAVVGGLDMGTVGEFREAIKRSLEAGQPSLLIDLREAERVDSSGLGALQWAAASAHRAGGAVHVVHASGAVDAALRRTGLKRRLVCPRSRPEQ